MYLTNLDSEKLSIYVVISRVIFKKVDTRYYLQITRC